MFSAPANEPANAPPAAKTSLQARPSSPPGAGCEPLPECTNDDFFEVGAALKGTGPFLVYSTNLAGLRQIHGFDLGTMSSIVLGRSAEVYGNPIINAQGSSLVIQLPGGRFAMLRRGSTLADDVLRLGENVAAIASSPDDRWIVVATRNLNDDGFVTITLRAADGSGLPRRLATFRSTSDGSGGSLEIFWSSPKSITVIDDCHCDGGSGQTTSYSLSLTRSFRVIPFLKDHSPVAPSPTSDGALFAFDDIPIIDCFVREHACDNILHTLSVADLRTRTLLTIARKRALRFVGVQLSPGGTLVAAGRDAFQEIQIYDVARRKLIASSAFFSASFEPVAWISETRLIALADSPDLVTDVQTGRLLQIDLAKDEAFIEPTTVVNGAGLRYLGLVHST